MKFSMVVRITAAVICAFSLLTAAQAEMKVSGYMQARYNFWDSELDQSDDFDFRRVRLKFANVFNEQGTEAVVQLDMSKLDDRGSSSKPIDFKDCTITHPLSENWKVRLGFTSIPFGFEVPYSSSRRLPFERSRAANKLFPGERDTGLYFSFKPDRANSPHVDFGYSNGVDSWRKTDKDNTGMMARARWMFDNRSEAGVSWYRGTREQVVSSPAQSSSSSTQKFTNDTWGAFVRWNFPKSWALQGEFYNGEILSTDVSGWYGQVEFKPETVDATMFYRYDVYEEKLSSSKAEYDRHTLGVGWNFSPKQRLTLQFEKIDDEKDRSLSNVGLQWQVSY